MSKASIIRTIVLVIALVNQSLVMAGKSPLPFEDAEVESIVSMVFTIAASILAWKHDNFDKKKK